MGFKWLRYVFIILNVIFVTKKKAIAQITPDTTLPNNSSVRVENNTSIIEAGTTVGGNLFHSFSNFSVNTRNEAFFNNAVDIRNIITRVTGQSVSNIDGIIKANGSANLFLLNPNGIIFGQNARLDIGGSFVGSTANAIGFGELGTFSATNPEAPTPLLTINPSALLFNQIVPLKIESNSVAPAGRNPSNESDVNGLRVPDGKSLLLVGGDVSVNGGGLSAFGGRVELGGLRGIGTVGLNIDDDNFSLNFPSGVEKSDVFLSNTAGVYAYAASGGSIAVNARNLEIAGDSSLSAGITNGLNININADVLLALLERSRITANSVDFRVGNINIKTQVIFRILDSSITAIGANSALSGNVNTTNLADPSKGLVPSYLNLFNVARLVDDNICARIANSSFTVTGRGGIPSSPENPAVSNLSWEDWRLLQVSQQQQRNVKVENNSVSNTASPASNQIVEAQGWIIDSNGTVILTATVPASLPQSNLSSQCHF